MHTSAVQVCDLRVKPEGRLSTAGIKINLLIGKQKKALLESKAA
jgi:hypothetical protein